MNLRGERKWNDVLAVVQNDDIGKKDFTITPRDLIMTGSGAIAEDKFMPSTLINNLYPNDYALGQLATRLGVPVKYAKKLMEQSPQLLAENINYWLREQPEDKDWMLRSKGRELRGLLSDKYVQLDNSFVFNMLNNVLDSGSAVRISNFDLSPTHFNVRLLFPQLNVNIGSLQNRDDVFVGVHITNSEVGASSLRIDSCIYRLVCENGMVSRINGESLMMQRHIHLTQNEMEGRVSEAIGKAMKIGDGIVDNFARSKDIAVENPMKMLEELSKKEKYSKKFEDTLKSSLNSEYGESLFHVVNAMTHASQSLPFDQRLEVEVQAGKVLERGLKK